MSAQPGQVLPLVRPAPARTTASSEAPVLIEGRGVSKTYRTREGDVETLRPLDFQIRAGEFVSVVGPSGCGKSTLMKMVAGLLPISGGELLLSGNPVRGPQTNVGIVFQSALLLPWRSVLDNILLQAEIRNMPRAAARERAAQLLEMAGLNGFENKYPWQLSGGMQQRTAIARALANDPKMLLLDEPFGALDNQTRVLMQELLLGIWESARKTVLFVTHDIDEAIFMANRVAVFSARPGRIKTEIAVDFPHPRHYTIKTSPEFMAIKARLTEEIRAESMASAEH